MPSQIVVVAVRIEVRVEWRELDGEDGGDVTFEAEAGFPLSASQEMEAFRIAEAAENVRRLKIQANTAHARAKADFVDVPWGPKPFR